MTGTVDQAGEALLAERGLAGSAASPRGHRRRVGIGLG